MSRSTKLDRQLFNTIADPLKQRIDGHDTEISGLQSLSGDNSDRVATLEPTVNANYNDVRAILNAYGQPDGVAQLDSNGHVPTSQLPKIAITDVYVVTDLAERDALTVEAGDIVKVIDSDGSGTVQTYIYDGTEWTDIQEGSDVFSVNGQTKDVYLDHSHIPTQGFSSTNWTAPEANVRGQLRGLDEFLTTLDSDFNSRIDSLTAADIDYDGEINTFDAIGSNFVSISNLITRADTTDDRLTGLETETHPAVTATDGTIAVGANQEISVVLSAETENLLETALDGGLLVKDPGIRVMDRTEEYKDVYSMNFMTMGLDAQVSSGNELFLTVNSDILFTGDRERVGGRFSVTGAIDVLSSRGATERRSIPANGGLQLENNSPAIQVLLADGSYTETPAINLPAAPVKDKHFALINHQSSTSSFTCNSIEIQPGDRYEVIYDGTEWIEL